MISYPREVTKFNGTICWRRRTPGTQQAFVHLTIPATSKWFSEGAASQQLVRRQNGVNL